jgi:hypothetical protein
MIVFDSVMLEEQKRAQAGRPEGSQGSAGGSARIPGLDEAGAAGGTSGADGNAESADEASGESAASGRRSTVAGAPGNRSGVTPEDIPSGDDDDVVARQLREAAEAETDPALREKLWDEYRRYKTGSGN